MGFLWWIAFWTVLMTFAGPAVFAYSKKPFLMAPRRNLLIRIPFAGLCPESPPENVVAENTTISYVGTKAFINSRGALLKELLFLEKAFITYRACRSATDEKYCEVFQTWRWGQEACAFLVQKNMIWSGIFQAFHPPLKCPIHKGEYRVVNATVDSSFAQGIFAAPILEKYFWRIKMDAFTDRLFVCFTLGVQFLRTDT